MNLKVFAVISVALSLGSPQAAAAQAAPARDIYQRIAEAERVPLQNRDAAALVQLGRDYRKVERPNDAAIQANEALKKSPESADALLLLGDLQLQRREFSKALATFSRVEQLRPALQQRSCVVATRCREWVCIVKPKQLMDFTRVVADASVPPVLLPDLPAG